MIPALIIVGIIVLLVAGLLGYAATKPDTFRVQRSASMKAPPEKIFPLINDFHNWVSWSPWEKLDLEMKKTHSGAASGKGAIYEWEGNKKVGQGRMEIMEAIPHSKVAIKLDFRWIPAAQFVQILNGVERRCQIALLLWNRLLN